VDNTHKVEPEEYVKLIQSDTLVFVDFYAPWCAPCRKIMPLIDSLKVQYQGKIRVEKVNADASKSLVRSLKMNTVPYFILYKNGQMVYTKPGIFTRSEISATFEKYLRTKQ
jgi:thioredoxin